MLSRDQVIAGVWVSLTVLTQPAVTMTAPAKAAKNFNFISAQCNRKRRARQARFLFGRDIALRCYPVAEPSVRRRKRLKTGATFIRCVAPQPGADGAARHPCQLRSRPLVSGDALWKLPRRGGSRRMCDYDRST